MFCSRQGEMFLFPLQAGLMRGCEIFLYGEILEEMLVYLKGRGVCLAELSKQ